MITTVTLNPAFDKLYTISDFRLNRLHRLGDFSKLLIEDEIDSYYSSPGGKGINVSIFMQRMGYQSLAMGVLGGHTGKIIHELVQREGITTNFVYGVGITRTNLTIYDLKHKTLTEINEPGNPILEEDIDNFISRFKLILNQSKYIIISGSIPLGTRTDLYKELIELANSHNVPVIVNTSRQPLIHAIEAGPKVVYPDMRSTYSLLNNKTETKEDYLNIARKIFQKNDKIELVIFSNITRGVIYYITQENIHEVTFTDYRIRNFLGFGDQLIGSLTISFLENKQLHESLIYASASGLANIESMNKYVTIPKLIDSCIPRIKIQTEKI